MTKRPRLRLLQLIRPDVRLSRAEPVHAFHELVYVLEGRYEVAAAGQPRSVPPHHAILYPAGAEHHPSWACDQSTAIYVLQWTGGSLPFGKPGKADEWVPDPAGRILVLLEWLRGLEREPGASARRNRILSVLLDELAAAHAGSVRPTDAVQTMLNFMHANLGHPITLEWLGREAGLSASHARTLFKQRMGEPPLKCVQRLRLEKALNLLLNSRASLHEIASEVGWDSAAHLSRLMRRHFGRSPRALRNSEKPSALRPDSPGCSHAHRRSWE